MFHILCINPGSTSTKLAVFEDDRQVFDRNIHHSSEDLETFSMPLDQLAFREKLVISTLKEANIAFDFDVVMGRGSLAMPVEGGVYEVNEFMLDITRKSVHQHASDLGCFIAYDIAKSIPSCKALIADPGVVDELSSLARISGSPLIPRICIWHALNQRAIARRYAKDIGKRYEDLDLIICHMGGGISIAAHHHGRAIDANNSLGGEGPFSPERAGSLPAADLVRICYSGQFTENELLNSLVGRAGLTAHLGTNDMIEILKRIDEGDQKAKLIVDAMVYQTAKSIAAEAAVLYGKVDAILLTGGIAYSDYIVNSLRKRVAFLAPFYCYPGENEMFALGQNALAVLKGEMKIKEYVRVSQDSSKQDYAAGI